MDDGAQGKRVRDYQAVRQDRLDHQRALGQNVQPRLAHPGILGDGTRHQAPAGQVVRQGNRSGYQAIRTGFQRGEPHSRILEIAAQLLGGTCRLAPTAAATRYNDLPVRGHRIESQDLQGPPAVEGIEDGLAELAAQAEDRFVHQCQGNLRRGRPALGIADLDGNGRRLARGIDGLIRRQIDLQGFERWLHLDLDPVGAQAAVRQVIEPIEFIGISFSKTRQAGAHRLPGVDGDKGVGGVRFEQRHLQHGQRGGQVHQLRAVDLAALEGQQRRAAEVRLDHKAGGLVGFVALLLGRDGDVFTIIIFIGFAGILPQPGLLALLQDIDVIAIHHRAPAGVLPRQGEVIIPGLGQCQREARLAVGARGRECFRDGVILPILPAPAGYDQFQLAPGHRLIVQGADIGGEGKCLAALLLIPAGDRQADLFRCVIDLYDGVPTDGLATAVIGGDFDGQWAFLQAVAPPGPASIVILRHLRFKRQGIVAAGVGQGSLGMIRLVRPGIGCVFSPGIAIPPVRSIIV